jgi:hypothetical protein
MSRLIAHARYWNDEADWLEASLAHIDLWEPEITILAEGNWDPAWPARSTDGTRQVLEAYTARRDNIYLVDNVREDANYRNNQAETSNLAMSIAQAEPGDWMIIIDCDHFYSNADIRRIRELMADEGDDFDYLVHPTRSFFYDISSCETRTDEVGTKLPYKILAGCRWIPTNHLSLDGKKYRDHRDVRRRDVDVAGMHYEGLRTSSRLDEKYKIGDRKSFAAHNDGERLRQLEAYAGSHPELAGPVLEKIGFPTS